MTSDTRLLQDVLRFQLDATHQQFFHLLALRHWGEKDAVARITEVDNVDFPGAMRIIDHLIAVGAPINLAPASFTPGQDYASILRAEHLLESRFAQIPDLDGADGAAARRLVEAASEPRQAYANWLADNIARTPVVAREDHPNNSILLDLVAHLVTMIEQSMIHAFVEWHGADGGAADAAWATSGAAMMQLTQLVRLFAGIPAVPVPGACPVPHITRVSGATLALDRELASQCEKQAREAAVRCDHDAIRVCCADIADYYYRLANWTPAVEHPAAATNPAAFNSFAATLARFVD